MKRHRQIRRLHPSLYWTKLLHACTTARFSAHPSPRSADSNPNIQPLDHLHFLLLVLRTLHSPHACAIGFSLCAPPHAPCSTKLKARLETADGAWVERIPAWIKWATQVCAAMG
jgi:hypothetical protein